jgi:hypothetical protein
MKSRKLMFAATVNLVLLAISRPLPAQEEPARYHHYKLIDLGTFGGPGSGLFESQHILTNGGTLVGWADTNVPDPYAPNCADSDCVIQHGFKWQRSVLTDLGSLSSFNNSAAQATNARGLTVGSSENGLIDHY